MEKQLMYQVFGLFRIVRLSSTPTTCQESLRRPRRLILDKRKDVRIDTDNSPIGIGIHFFHLFKLIDIVKRLYC